MTIKVAFTKGLFSVIWTRYEKMCVAHVMSSSVTSSKWNFNTPNALFRSITMASNKGYSTLRTNPFFDRCPTGRQVQEKDRRRERMLWEGQKKCSNENIEKWVH